MDFPAEPVEQMGIPLEISGAIWTGRNRMDWFVVLESATAVRTFLPDYKAIGSAGMRGLCITAPGDMHGVDFVSRFFAPQSGVPEDSVTGSAHCGLACLWADRFGRKALTGYQASRRGGYVHVERVGERVKLGGRAICIVQGELCA